MNGVQTMWVCDRALRLCLLMGSVLLFLTSEQSVWGLPLGLAGLGLSWRLRAGVPWFLGVALSPMKSADGECLEGMSLALDLEERAYLSWQDRPGFLARALGADLGSGVVLAPRVRMVGSPLVTLGDGARVGFGGLLVAAERELSADSDDPTFRGRALSVGEHSLLEDGVRIEAGTHLGARVRIGAGAVVEAGCVVQDGSVLAPGSRLLSGSIVPAGELWVGTPACFVADVERRGAPERRDGSRSAEDRRLPPMEIVE